jgi:signal transduction histidine kinase
MDEHFSQVRVLLVDDDESLLDALSQMLRLRFRGIQVDIHDSALGVLPGKDLNVYDAIISDIKMPGMDGLEMLANIRRHFPEVPVLLITGHGESDLAIKALRAQAFDLISKPIDRDYLVATLTNAIELRRLRREVLAKQIALEKHASELEERVRERTIELERANQSKDEFLGIVSHELRTPLTIIMGSLEVLDRREQDLTEEDKTQLNIGLRTQSHRLQRIIENLLILARSEIGDKVQTEPICLNRSVMAQIQAHERLFPERMISTHLVKDTFVDADSVYLELILGNLLSNAEKYSDEGQPIEVSVVEEDHFGVVSIRDRGQGLSAEEAKLIFEPFFRSEQARTMPGAGVGLTVCRRLTEAQGGSISASAREGGGSEFTFRLPLAGKFPADAVSDAANHGTIPSTQ